MSDLAAPPVTDNVHLLDVEPLATKRIELTTDSDSLLLSIPQGAIRGLFDQIELSEDDEGRPIEMIQIAMEEAFYNAVVHGNMEDKGADAPLENKERKVTIRISVSEVAQQVVSRGTTDIRTCVVNILLRAEVENEGNGFEVNKVPDCTEEENREKPSGRGLLMMRSVFCDTVYHPEQSKGRVIVFISGFMGRLRDRKITKPLDPIAAAMAAATSANPPDSPSS
ncbi:MAG: ATP-binding protein [bacterium]|nr:ATP-binding protein [bacterium]